MTQLICSIAGGILANEPEALKWRPFNVREYLDSGDGSATSVENLQGNIHQMQVSVASLERIKIRKWAMITHLEYEVAFFLDLQKVLV